jgi:hypothetical protein
MRNPLRSILVLAVTAGCVAEQEPSRDVAVSVATPPVPYEDVGACPFEGCVYREWTANAAVDARAERNLTAPVSFQVTAGEKVIALDGIVVTTRPGRVEFDAAADVDATDGSFHVDAGQTVYLLTAEGEGFMKAWFNGRVYEGVDTATFSNGGCAGIGRLVEPWQFVWWIQIRNSTGQVGWTREPERFDNKDARG